MENPKRGKKNLLSPEKAATFIPVFISSFISILVIIFFVAPQYFRTNKVNMELDGLIKKKSELENLKTQYKIINDKFDKLHKEKLRIIELITGTSKLDTLLAKLGEIGENNNIKFTSIIPLKSTTLEEKSNIKNNNKKNRKTKSQIISKKDPLLVEGIKKYEFDFLFKTDFVNLLSFLRELEFQDNVILIDDINIKSTIQSSNSKEIDDSKDFLEVKIKIAFYGKI